MGPVERASARGKERLGDVLGVLEQGPATERDRVRHAQDGGRDRRGRAARHALVAAGPVDGHRSEADAGDAVVEGVDAGRALVGPLVDAVVGGRVTLRGFLEPVRLGVRVGRRKRPDRARVDERRHRPARTLDGLEQVDRADDVDERAERRIRARERDLEGGEVDHVRDPVLVERPLDGRQVGDVAGDERGGRELVVGHDLGQPASVAAEIVGNDRNALADQRSDRPRADAAEGAGDEEPLLRRRRVHAELAQVIEAADVLEPSDPLDLDDHDVARGKEPRWLAEDADARRRARGDDVARLQAERLRAVADDLGDAEVHLRRVSVLEELAVH